MKRYIIDAQTLQQPDFEFELKVGMELFEAMDMTDVTASDFTLTLTGARLSSNKTELSVSGCGTVVVPCDRCLEDVSLAVDVMGTMDIFFGDEAKAFDGLEVTLQRGDELSVAQFVYDSIMLGLPIMRAHEPGECNPDMLARISGMTE
ncbi:MAG: DUF177 domain-containing protein [Alistipes sp.]|nr:DUF177 domain-containing protein [Alistipes sp.]